MPFYRLIKDSGTILKLIPRNQKESTGRPAYFSKWELSNQDTKRFQCAQIYGIAVGTIGLLIGEAFANRVGKKLDNLPMKELLIGDERIFIYNNHLELVSEEEIEKMKHGK